MNGVFFIKSPLNVVSEDLSLETFVFFYLQVSSELPIGSSAASTSAIKKKIQAKMAGGGGASPASASQTGVSPVQTVSPEQMAANKAAFLEKVRLSNAACQAGDFSQVWPLTQLFSVSFW